MKSSIWKWNFPEHQLTEKSFQNFKINIFEKLKIESTNQNIYTSFPLIPEISNFHKKAFANKAIEYYNRMGKDSLLQQKYAEQKVEVDAFITSLS